MDPTSYDFRVPSPPQSRQSSPDPYASRRAKCKEKYEHRVPSPPPRRQRRRDPHASGPAKKFPSGFRVPSPPPPRQRRRVPHVSRKQRVPSPPTVRRSVSAEGLRPHYEFRVPSPPLNRRPEGQRKDGRGFSNNTFPTIRGVPDYQWVLLSPPQSSYPPLDVPRRRYFDDRDTRPRTPQSLYPRVDTGYLSPLDGVDYFSSGGDRPQGLKRWKSERTLGPNAATPTASLTPPNSTFRSSLASSPVVLGDQGYQYRALQDSEFRLVRVFPERKTMVKCEIIHASLEEPPRYVAISYAWGDAGDTRKIELEGSFIPVGASLYGALKALRQKVESVLVWVDALCIDQHNRDERTQQVQLMTGIYSTADSVAIWLGPEADDSALAIDLLRDVADQADSPEKISRLISSRVGKPDLAAVVSLFERDYWRRLWVVQEIFNARSITVHCGSTKLQWAVYQRASDAFRRHRADLDYYFPVGRTDSRRHTSSLNQFSYSQVLVYQGPGSLLDLRSDMGLGEGSLLEVLRACRRKLASDAKDKLYGILGVLPEETRKEFRADYSLSVKDVYTEVVDYLLKTTERLDVICDAIHFPVHTGSANLPSYVPDWSHIPQTAAMGHKYNFSAAGTTKANCRFLDERLNKLEIAAIYLDTISINGISVGTLCTLADYLMAFLHWMALLMASLDNETEEYSLKVQKDFCRTISLDQVPQAWDRSDQWLTVCYHVFASLLCERLPHLPLNQKLRDYVDKKVDIRHEARRQFLQKHFGDRMMGRCFCITAEKRIGMGSGFMLPGDIVVMPLGCSTPVLLRLEGTRGEYRFVGDVYIHGYMRGKAVDQWKDGKREVSKYVLH
jgi:hypothetical protein